MKVFKLLLVSITYLLIGVLEVYSYFLFKADVIGMFAFLTICGLSECDEEFKAKFKQLLNETKQRFQKEFDEI